MNERELPNLYSLTAIGVGTFLGSVLAAGYMLASNYAALGQKKLSNWVIGISLFWVTLMLFMPTDWSTSPGPAIVLLIGQVIAVLLITQKLQGAMFKTYEEMGGRYFTIWRAVLVGVVASFALLFGAVFLMALFGSTPQPPS